MIVPAVYFTWFVTSLVFVVSIVWLVVDTVRLRRALREGRAGHDRVFGSIIGLTMAVVGIVGVFIYHLR